MDTINSDDYINIVDCAMEIDQYLRGRGYSHSNDRYNDGIIVEVHDQYNKNHNIYPFTFRFDRIQNCYLKNKLSSISVIGYQYRNMTPKMLIRMCYYMYEHIYPFLIKYKIKEKHVNFYFEDIRNSYTLDYLVLQPTFSPGLLMLDK